MKGADQCPRCASRRWADVQQPVTDFYAGVLRVCGNCGTAWEPFDVSDLLDQSDRLSSFRHPCGNCAFRKGSPEQRDPEEWESKMISMSFGAGFYCHKGVPVTPSTDHGFDYPADRRKLRLCRGYLNSIVGPRLNELAHQSGPSQADGEAWADEL
jgi:transcription elongation factor Elf1